LVRPEEEIEVTVISREEVVTFPKIATPVINVLVTYVSMGLPPATVTIPKDQWTLEYEKRVIREDIEARLKREVQTYRV